ncbi:MAG TPA: transposase [Candidatus Acidoferrum sp.]|nr:transposase [Candidatus Acidoferrum sp.]
MSRLRRIETAGRFFFITTNLRKGAAPLAPAERDICLDALARARTKHRFALFAYAIMPDHVHLLVQTREAVLPQLMRDWKSASGFAVAKRRGKRTAIWQARYFDFILRRASDFGPKFDYIHNNPVTAGLVSKPEDWPWSSAAFYGKRGSVRLRPDVFEVPSDPNEPLWPVPWK